MRAPLEDSQHPVSQATSSIPNGWEDPFWNATHNASATISLISVSTGKTAAYTRAPSRSVPGYATCNDDGRPEAVSFFHNEDNPVTVGLVVDCGTSMQQKSDAVIAAGVAFAQSSHPKDEMFTVNFNEHVWDGLSASMPFTTNVEDLRTALERTTARGKTALFDGLGAALKHLSYGHCSIPRGISL